MRRPVVYLDLDRTLFQTDRIGEVWVYLAQQYPGIIDPKYERQRAELFYEWCNDLYCYDMSSQLRQIGLIPEDIYHEVIASPLADGRLEYTDCSSLVNFLKTVSDLAILTYGRDDYQRFKAALCPSLAGIPIETTLETKAEVLKRTAVHGIEVWLVDDKPIGSELPASIRFIQVNLEARSGDNGKAADNSRPVCSTLREVEDYFRQTLVSTRL